MSLQKKCTLYHLLSNDSTHCTNSSVCIFRYDRQDTKSRVHTYPTCRPSPKASALLPKQMLVTTRTICIYSRACPRCHPDGIQGGLL